MANQTVLVVDDDRLLRESLCELLAEFGCQHADAASGLSGWQCLSKDSFGLVFSDVDMPDISGFELLARMHQHNIAAPMVLMSARADQAMATAARSAGAVSLLAKPLPLQPVADLVDRYITNDNT